MKLTREDVLNKVTSGESLEGLDLSGLDLRWLNLSILDLSVLDFKQVNLSKANLRGADLRGANLIEADLSAAYLNEADLKGANLEGAKLCLALSDIDTIWESDLLGEEAYKAELNSKNMSNESTVCQDVSKSSGKINPIHEQEYKIPSFEEWQRSNKK